MGLIARKKKGSNIPPLEAGTYMAICVGIIDIGEQKNEKYNKYEPKVIFIFEIPSETVEVDGESKPRWLSRTYTNSLSDKSNLRSVIVAWRGKNLTKDEEDDGVDLSQMLGTACQLQVITETNDDRSYNKIAAIVGIPKGMPQPKTENELLLYDMDEPDEDVFAKLPEWIQDNIRKSTEYQSSHTGTEELDVSSGTTQTNTKNPKHERSTPF